MLFRDRPRGGRELTRQENVDADFPPGNVNFTRVLVQREVMEDGGLIQET